MKSKKTKSEGPAPLSRGEAERLAVLDAIEAGGVDSVELAKRLGLPSSLAEAVGTVARSLVEQGLVAVEEETGDGYRLSEEGRRYVEGRLEELGV